MTADFRKKGATWQRRCRRQTPSPHVPTDAAEYNAFLSYTHRDRPVVSGIQKGLHRIGRRLGQLRALRVFRDDTDLAASPDLWGRITEALDRSRFFVVTLSPGAAASQWVDQEISYWLERRGRDQLLLVLAAGHLHWDQDSQCFDPGVSDAAPPVLTVPGSLPVEPLFIDVSTDAPWDFRGPVFREKITALAAPIHGKPKDQLASDDLREQRRFRRLRAAAIAGLVVLTVAAGRRGDHRRGAAAGSPPPAQPGHRPPACLGRQRHAGRVEFGRRCAGIPGSAGRAGAGGRP